MNSLIMLLVCNDGSEAFAIAEQERDGGVSPHVSPFVGVADVGNLLMGASFSLPTGMSATTHRPHRPLPSIGTSSQIN
jgi:hypothetical protein